MTEENAIEKDRQGKLIKLPVLPLRDVVIFPNMIVPLFVGRPSSVKSLQACRDEYQKKIFLLSQKDLMTNEPTEKDLYSYGTVAIVLQMLQLADGTVKILVEGVEQAKCIKLSNEESYLTAELEYVGIEENMEHEEIPALMRTIISQFVELAKINKKIPMEVLNLLERMNDPIRLTNAVAAHLTSKVEARQKILECLDIVARLNLIAELVQEEIENFKTEGRIQKRLKERVNKNQQQYYLREKIHVIQDELSEMDDKNSPADEWKVFEKRIKASGMPKEVREKATTELHKLKLMPPISAEATVSRNYVEWLLDVPWKKRTSINRDLEKAKEILEIDHYGLEKVKERILEYLAVQHRVSKIKGPILCFVGPPGVGKTSLGQSIARATGRKFARISLGGMRDEAEIRGHRRTYIGALPGKIIQKIAKTKVRNPLVLLDEVDKMSSDFRGDPASALLEVLDPEQNNTFNDHYLEVDYDLSDVMFITTANSLDIPLALADRMEIIRLAGYTENEKFNIAVRHLISKQQKLAGLKKEEFTISDKAVIDIIRYYTKEAGVRSLEREISKLCRRVVKEILENKEKRKSIRITQRNLEKYLGVKRFRFGLAEEKDEIGQVTGLAWTQVGGELLRIEVQILPGKGNSLYTGHLGDVMQESIQAAMTVTRARSTVLGISAKFYQKHDFHIHVPEGATPKDGPSAGIGMCTALISALTRSPVRADVAMTGEITLRGEVLPIGGLKEKLLAALRGGIKTVIIPEENARELKELPLEVRRHLTIKPVKWIDEVLQIALTQSPNLLIENEKDEALISPEMVSTTQVEDRGESTTTH